MKRLEFHLSTIEELYDTYDLHRKLREGVRNMAQVVQTELIFFVRVVFSTLVTFVICMFTC